MSYARLGNNCQANMSVLIDNKKFFSIDDPIYNVLYTKMNKYPSTHQELQPVSDEVEKPEDIKTSKQKERIPEEYSNNYCTGCGNK